ncbi:apiosidase-like domain-containing protein [Algoriphagus boritolerans]|uniref:apiosidase-like domain-containing protein n=1 Tax=Algoriphagus boritolerans TaxID=308111 RepID=UPI000CDEC7E2|nr:DUF4038 domain-containing protein [Algoriphagus boritolerans]
MERYHRLDENQTNHYLDTRKAKGFAVVQTVILPELDGISTPKGKSGTPFINLEKRDTAPISQLS